jgi:hypothetical protein
MLFHFLVTNILPSSLYLYVHSQPMSLSTIKICLNLSLNIGVSPQLRIQTAYESFRTLLENITRIRNLSFVNRNNEIVRHILNRLADYLIQDGWLAQEVKNDSKELSF